MYKLYKILLIVLPLNFLACDLSRAEKPDKDIANQSLSNSHQLNEVNNSAKSNEECMRGQAEPIIKKEAYSNTTFVLQADSLTAIETVEFSNGDKLIIHNWGCEYYVLTFRFETSRFRADTTSMKYWYVNSAKLMNEIKNNIEAGVDIEEGVEALNKYISANAFNLKLNKEIDFGINEVRNFVTLERISQISKDRYAVTMSFTVGPL